MTEAELQAEVIAMARELGLLVFHSGDSRRDTGKGFPDLVIVGPGGVLFAELKSASGSRAPEQSRWWHALVAAHARYVLWRPSDFRNGEAREVLELLTGQRPFGWLANGRP